MIGRYMALQKPKRRVAKFSALAERWKPLDTDEVHGLAIAQGELLEEILTHVGEVGRKNPGVFNEAMLKLAHHVRDMILDSRVCK